jgi:hypothetical protein
MTAVLAFVDLKEILSGPLDSFKASFETVGAIESATEGIAVIESHIE